MRAVLKEVDKQGRVVLPAAWRRKHLRGKKVLVREGEGRIEIIPQDEVDLTAYFDGPKVDIRSDLADWKGVRRELQKR